MEPQPIPKTHMLPTGSVTDPCRHGSSIPVRVGMSVAVLALMPMWLGALSLADDAVATNPGDDVPAAQIDEWVEQLASGEFAVRALATDSLIDAGLPAVEPVMKAMAQGDLEVVVRGIHVLREIALSGPPHAQDAALTVLEQLANDPRTSTGRRASAMLSRLAVLRQRRALDELQQLGARVYTPDVQIGRQIVFGVLTVEIDDQFRGDRQDLSRLKWLPEVEQIVFDGPQVKDEWLAPLKQMGSLSYITLKRAEISDAGLRHLGEVPQLHHLRILYCPITDRGLGHLKKLKRVAALTLFGTQVTPVAAAQLANELATVDVDYRRGAFLGIGGSGHPLGFLVSTVHADSAAARIGMAPGDVIVKFDGEKVVDFTELTALIGRHQPGDKVRMEVLRGGKPLAKEVQLGAWE